MTPASQPVVSAVEVEIRDYPSACEGCRRQCEGNPVAAFHAYGGWACYECVKEAFEGMQRLLKAKGVLR